MAAKTPLAGATMQASSVGLGLWLTLLVMPAGASPTEPVCEPIPDMFCVSQRVFTHRRSGESGTVTQMFVYRFRDGGQVEIAHGNPPVSTKENLRCVDGHSYRGLMHYAFSDDWREGVAAFIDPGMSTVEFLECAPED